MNTRTPEIDMQHYWLLVGFLLIVLMPEVLYAQMSPLPPVGPTVENSVVGNSICVTAGNLLGNAARGIATIGVSIVGILALVGRITWIQGLIVGVGITVLFGAAALIPQLSLGMGTPCNYSP